MLYTNSCISAFERILRAWCSSLLQVRIEVAGRSTLFGGSSMTHERTLGGWRLGRAAMLLRRSYSDDLRRQTSPNLGLQLGEDTYVRPRVWY